VPRHDVDLLSLMAGVAFIGTAVAFLLDTATDLSADWLWPVLLIVVGVAGLAASRTGSNAPR
jgi:hypothetical protein